MWMDVAGTSQAGAGAVGLAWGRLCTWGTAGNLEGSVVGPRKAVRSQLLRAVGRVVRGI